MDGGAPQPLEYSAASTLIPFPRPLPLLRGPIKAGPLDDPSSGPYLLAFKNRRAWAAAYRNCRAQIIAQCELGARVGCSISASSKCKPPWWKVILGVYSKQDFREREKCEEIEMEACFAAAKERCSGFAKQRCEPAFRNARIGASGFESSVVDWKDVSRLISTVCFANEKSYGVGFWGVDKSWGEFRQKYEVTSLRGKDLLGSDYLDIEEYLRKILV
ncbi:uncharacterized protein LOC131016333 [Salvia miltiorrhiza]|uniref:uncharacterized protein LOC131016333 n=1 Tax=Salvia miltiorrhiza TaxID=226208 RepID=UPI0025AD3963|nr:uncharacterized protein LOC131016333 [Salvia miltiorrhiza]XP_057801008.1 uncharacterized protein LOC131016333 [Salvia miltiorrhiza]